MAWCCQATSHYLNRCWLNICYHMASPVHNEWWVEKNPHFLSSEYLDCLWYKTITVTYAEYFINDITWHNPVKRVKTLQFCIIWKIFLVIKCHNFLRSSTAIWRLACKCRDLGYGLIITPIAYPQYVIIYPCSRVLLFAGMYTSSSKAFIVEQKYQRAISRIFTELIIQISWNFILLAHKK